MNAELIAVGSELLRLGRRDTNGDWLTERLYELGVEVRARSIIEDDMARIAVRVKSAAAGADVLIVTGGLGPTADDRTREALAGAFGLPLERDTAMVERLSAAFAAWGRRWKDLQAVQADRPRGARWIPNPVGTAPGLWLEQGSCTVVALPGVPAEMRRMFDDTVRPALEARAPGALAGRVLKVGGRTESAVEERVRDLYTMPGLDVTILSGREGIELGLRATGRSREEAEARLAAADERFVERLGDDLYGRDRETLPGEVGRLLLAVGATLAAAESCTAGLLAAALTDVPGASAWFRGGLVVYADDLKQSLAGIAPETLDRHGSVSEATARELAAGARRVCGADLGVGITGIAGPGGGSATKPVGLVHVALDHRQGSDHWSLRMIGDRDLVRRRTVTFALDRIRRHLLAAGGGTGRP